MSEYDHEVVAEGEAERHAFDSQMRAEYDAEMRAEHDAEMSAEYMADMPSPGELAEMQRGLEEYQLRNALFDRMHAELGEFRVEHRRPTADNLVALQKAIKDARVEEDLQVFLTENPHILLESVGWGHRSYVLPTPKLGNALVPDFLVARTNSMGVKWHGVELEPVSPKMFTKKGQPTADLTHAVQQVLEWRSWISNNIAYAQRPTSEDGLGLVGIDGNLPSTVLMGRRTAYPPEFNSYRNQTDYSMRISIQSYDSLLDSIESRIALLTR